MKSLHQTKKRQLSPSDLFRSFNSVFSYFSFFEYPPSFDEIFLFYPKKISKEKLQTELDRKVKLGEITVSTIGEKQHYCKANNKSFLKIYKKRREHALKLLSSFRFKLYVQALTLLPWIEFVGISGSVAMMNAKKGDDIDLFVISSSYRLWTARLICMMLAEVLGFRRRRHDKNTNGKVCLNLFFDGCDLAIPVHKKNPYVAHEIIQLWPLVNKQNMYQRFLRENEKWVIPLFPNSDLQNGTNKNFSAPEFSASAAESIARKLQMHFIDKHKTTEYITQTQLWFFPSDFEKKIRVRD